MKESFNDKLNLIDVVDFRWTPNGNPVLDGISLELEKGRFYGILGPNGAGKTSFAKSILKFVLPNEGALKYNDRDIRNISRKEIAKEVSFLSQNVNSDLDFTVYDVVAMGRDVYHPLLSSFDKKDYDIIERALETCDCTKFRDAKFKRLSGGERQRVMIARAIAQDTPWIILDEPVSNLDVAHQTELMHLFEELRKNDGKTIIAVLHDINLAAEFCTDIIFLKDGKVKYAGETAEILTESNLSEVYEIPFFKYEIDNGKKYAFLPDYLHGNSQKTH